MTKQNAKKIFLSLAVFALLSFPLFVLARSESPRAEIKTGAVTTTTVANTATEGETEMFSTLLSASSIEIAYRIVRVLSVVFALLFINMILAGSFRYMVTSIDDNVLKARKNIIVGSLGTMVFICLYFLATAAIVRIEAGL
jgi:hypothetical protein